MGWCSATEIMDTALDAAMLAVRVTIDGYAQGNADSTSIEARIDEVLRPFVAKLAEHLRDGDWDCIEESQYFHRFPQEMLGKDDRQYEEWLTGQLQYTNDIDQRKDLVRKLSALHEKMG